MLLFLLIVIGAGMALSSQAAINGKLGASVGVVKSSLLTFTVGAVVTGLLIFFFEPVHQESLLTVPKWQLTGALFGVVYMITMVYAVPKVGVATATVATIFGQLLMSLLLDTFGWLGNPAIELNIWRVSAMLCVGLALVCIHLGSKEESRSQAK